MKIIQGVVYSALIGAIWDLLKVEKILQFDDKQSYLDSEGIMYSGLVDFVQEQFPGTLEIERTFQYDHPSSIKDIDIPDDFIPLDEPHHRLRTYQIKAIKKAVWKGRGVIEMATGSGKTDVAAAIFKYLLENNYVEQIFFVAETRFLMNQAADRFERRGLGDYVRRFGGGNQFKSGQLQVCVIDSLRRAVESKDEEVCVAFAECDAICFDECFPAGTFVGNSLIEDIQVGDTVPSFDESRGEIVHRRVTRKFERTCDDLLLVQTSRDSVSCTPNHPFLTTRGWVNAGSLEKTDYVLKVWDLRSKERFILEWARVEGTEIYKPRSSRRSRRMCGSYTVYNLEVEETHTYVANSFVVHNCHHLQAKSWVKIGEECTAKYRYGLTATLWSDPFKYSFSDFRLIGLTGAPVACIPSVVLRRQGFLAEPFVSMIDVTHPAVYQRKWKDYYRTGIVQHPTRNSYIVSLARSLYEGDYKTLVFVNYISHGLSLVKALRNYGVENVCFVRGGETMYRWRPSGRWDTSRTSIESLAEMVRDEEQCVVVGNVVLDEGIDIPSFNALIMGTAMKKYRRSLQRVGRGMRPKEGDNSVYIFDFIDSTQERLMEHSEYRMRTYQIEQYEFSKSLMDTCERMGIPILLEEGLYTWENTRETRRKKRRERCKAG